MPKNYRNRKRGKTSKAIDKLIQFIEQKLPNFPNSDEYVDILEKKKNENQHSLSFCAYMTNECNSRFYFARENAQNRSSTVDIGIYKGSNLIFTIEAKLLPIPVRSKKDKRKEYEYVYGKGAGMQRFKENNHGLDNSDKLLVENGLIAFVKEDSFETWFLKINQWILDANWPETEQLQKDYFGQIAKLKSKHTRIDDSNLILHHFWVNVAQKAV